MSQPVYQPKLFKLALVTLLLTLAVAAAGMLVTAQDAGMAFPDWPSSDGHNLFLYPWLSSKGDKFLEHGHRLIASLLGLVSIGFAILLFKYESRRWVTLLGILFLMGVITQGLIGGMRVLQNNPTAAMYHSLFGAVVFTLMGLVTLFESRGWFNASTFQPVAVLPTKSLKVFATLTPIVIFMQYILGAMLRHLGKTVYEHMGWAILVLFCLVITASLTMRTGVRWLSRPGLHLLILGIIQIALGIAAYVFKFGFASTGYVAVRGSIQQVTVRTIHTLVAMVLFMSSMLSAFRIYRWSKFHDPSVIDLIDQSSTSAEGTTMGGAS